MIFDSATAKKLEVLVNPEVEKAIYMLLDSALSQFDSEYNNPAATDAQLRMYLGQKLLIKELKDYRKRINDAVKREKDGSE